MMPFAVLVSVMMGLVQIAIFKSIPFGLRNLLSTVPIIAILLNFLISGVVLVFTGVGMYAGVGNLAGSVIFAVYLSAYVSYRKISAVKFRRFLWLFLYPYVDAREGDHWLF